MPMEVISCNQRHNKMNLSCRIKCENDFEKHWSTSYTFEKTTFQFYITTQFLNTYNAKFNGNYEKVSDDSWHLLTTTDVKEGHLCFDFDIHVTLGPIKNPLARLYEDTDLMDFELCGEDGSVKVHKSILALFSPVLKTMLCGDWRETTEVLDVHIPGTSKETLQQLKDYMYLGTVPDTNLEKLTLLSSYYMIPDLEQICSDKLVEKFDTDKIWEALQYVQKIKSNRLLSTFLQTMDSTKVHEVLQKLPE